MAAGIPTALVIVGVQNDFCTGGPRGVPGGEKVAAPLSYVANAIDHGGGLVVAVREWHSEASPWFRPNGGDEEPYCIAGSKGAAFHRDLSLSRRTRIVFRSSDPALGGSAFHTVDRRGKPLADLLADAGAERILLGGIPTEGAVRATALDALRRGLGVTLIQDGVASGDEQRGREVMKDLRWSGAEVAGSGQAIMGLYTSGQLRFR